MQKAPTPSGPTYLHLHQPTQLIECNSTAFHNATRMHHPTASACTTALPNA